MDNTRIHHYRGLMEDNELSQYTLKYLSPYSPFLNPIENVFSVCKNYVVHGDALNENKSRLLIVQSFYKITYDHCGSFYQKMLGYLIRSAAREIIYE
ncbi:hypothetical protein A0H76_1344 [Hepatospora eriocheir]|uniref:Tc1-like transposase DDE domain-containing protein n=1 Tax=Hepatospora eriocheir TaxID=1081669 RepID=A0A1X0QH95_9MICR|nr:hypothetical protein A0H76_1344 [Hepatospora eriocheir]